MSIGIVLANVGAIVNQLSTLLVGGGQPNRRWLQVRGFPGPDLRRWVVFFRLGR